MTGLLLCVLLVVGAGALDCGYPGSPAHGRPLTYTSVYRAGLSVFFQCDRGYFLLGGSSRRCLVNGTWEGRLPLCERAEALPGPDESSTQQFSAHRALDGQAETCDFIHGRGPRWWRGSLGPTSRHVRAVVIALPPAPVWTHGPPVGPPSILKVQLLQNRGGLAHYIPCGTVEASVASFESRSRFVPCANGGADASYIHIEDSSDRTGSLGLCEVQVVLRKERYECGQPEQPDKSYVAARGDGQVRYDCIYGHALVGPAVRVCDPDTGTWTGAQPSCQLIDCGSPNFGNTTFQLLNGTTVYGSVARLECGDGDTLSRCLQNGSWGDADCGVAEMQEMVTLPPHLYSPRQSPPLSPAVIVGISLAILMLLVLGAATAFLYKRRDAVRKHAAALCLSWKGSDAADKAATPGGADILAMYAKVNYDRKRRARLQRELSSYREVWRTNELYGVSAPATELT